MSLRPADQWLPDNTVGGSEARASISNEEGRPMVVHKLSKTLVVTLAALFVMAIVALAAERPGAGASGRTGYKAAGETVSGTVQDVNEQEGSIMLRSEDGKTVELQATPALVYGLQIGDAVAVKMSGKRATAIDKKEEGSRPDMSGARQRQLPGATPRSQ